MIILSWGALLICEWRKGDLLEMGSLMGLVVMDCLLS